MSDIPASATFHFDGPLREFAAAINVALETATRRVASDLLTRIVKATPVDTGRARSGWDLTVDEPSSMLPEQDDDGTFTLQTDPPALELIDGTQVVYITNNLPYIERLENGWSQQAPAGMVRMSLDAVAAEIEILLEDLEDK